MDKRRNREKARKVKPPTGTAQAEDPGAAITAMPAGKGSPEIRELFTVAPEVAYSPILLI
jgi:hypothetical protein